MASTKYAWNFGSMAVSTFSTLLTTDFDLAPRGLVQEGNPGAVASGVADRRDRIERTVRNHAEGHGVAHIDVAAEGPGQAYPIHRGHPKPVHQQTDTRKQRRLGELDLTYIGLRDGDVIAVDGEREGAAIAY